MLIAFTRYDIFHFINTHYSSAGDRLMYYTTYLGQGEIIVPALILLMIIPRFRNAWYFFVAACCNLIPFAIQQGLKSIFDHPRPLLRYYDMTWIHHPSDWPTLLHRSFPSGHSQGAFSFFCFLSLLLPPKYNKLGILFFMTGAAVMYSRIYLAAHFFEDVYFGSMLGGMLTTAIFTILMQNSDKFTIFNKKGTFI